MAQNAGKKFENAIKASADKLAKVGNAYYYRLKDSGSSFNPNEASGLRFTPSNDYDCFIFQQPFFFPMELKSCAGTSFSFQITGKEKGKNIKKSQIDGLHKASVVKGVYAGLLFNFRKVNHTYWLNISDFISFMDNTTKKSINEKDIIDHGGVLMEQTLKRVNYSYNVEKLLEDIKNKYK